MTIADKIRASFLKKCGRKLEAKKAEAFDGQGQQFYTANDYFSLAEILPDKTEQKSNTNSEKLVNIVIGESDIFSALHKFQGDVLICDVDRKLLNFLEAQINLMRSLSEKYKQGLKFEAVVQEYHSWLQTQEHASALVSHRKEILGDLHFLHSEANFIKAIEALQRVNIATVDINCFEKEEQDALVGALNENKAQVKTFNLTNLSDYDVDNRMQYLLDNLPWVKDPLIVWNIHDRGPLSPHLGVDPYRHYLFTASSPTEYKRHFETRPQFFAEIDIESLSSGSQLYKLNRVKHHDLRRYTEQSDTRERYEEKVRQSYLVHFDKWREQKVMPSLQTICERYSVSKPPRDQLKEMPALRKLQPSTLLNKVRKLKDFFHFDLPERIKDKVALMLSFALEKCLETGDIELAKDIIHEINGLVNFDTDATSEIIRKVRGYPLLVSYLERFIKQNTYSKTIEAQLEEIIELLSRFEFDRDVFITRMQVLGTQGFQLANSCLLILYKKDIAEIPPLERSRDHPIIRKVIEQLNQMATGSDQAAAKFAIKELRSADIDEPADFKDEGLPINQSKLDSSHNRLSTLLTPSQLREAIETDPTIVNIQFEQGETVAHRAVRAGCGDEFFSVLFESKVDLSIKDVNGLTPVHTAAYGSDCHDNSVLSRYLEAAVKQGFNFAAQDVEGNTVLHAVVGKGKSHSMIPLSYANVSIIMKLIPDIDLDAVNSKGYTSLQLALLNGNFNAAKYLVACGANLTKSYGNNPSALDMLGDTIFEKLMLRQLDKELVEPVLLEKEIALKTKAADLGIHTSEDYEDAYNAMYPSNSNESKSDSDPEELRQKNMNAG